MNFMKVTFPRKFTVEHHDKAEYFLKKFCSLIITSAYYICMAESKLFDLLSQS